MATERMEELLEQLVEQNASIIERLEDVVHELKAIKGELDWAEATSFAKVAIDGVEEIVQAVRDSSG